jgi:biopolymer transport protein TolR
MAFRMGDDDGGLLGDINVTPLVDVMLVLLILFMITAPMLQQGVAVDLPDAEARNIPQKQTEPVVLSLRKDGLVYIGKEPVQAPRVAERLRAVLRGRTEEPVYLRGDQEVPYGKVISLLDSLERAGIVHVNLVTESIERPARPAQ